MDRCHSVSLHAELGLLHARRWGEWTEQHVSAYRRDLQDAIGRASGLPSFDVLIDSTAASLMPQAVAAGMNDAARLLLASPARRIAFVASSALARVQAKRILGGNAQVQFFSDEEAARDWLRS